MRGGLQVTEGSHRHLVADGPVRRLSRGRAVVRVRGRGSTRPTRPSETAGTVSSVPAPTSMPVKPSVTATWRRSCAASRLQEPGASSWTPVPRREPQEGRLQAERPPARIRGSSLATLGPRLARGCAAPGAGATEASPPSWPPGGVPTEGGESGGASDDGFSAIKLTALGRPQFLLQFSDVLTKWRRFFHQMAAEQGKTGLAAMDTKLEVAVLQESVAKMGIASRTEIENWFTAETLGVSGFSRSTLDLLDWNSLIDSRTELSKHLVVPNMQTGQLEPLLSRFTEEEELQMTRMLQRMDILAKKAAEMGVRLMVDAEQTYFQPAISRLTLEMQRKFNVEKPLIFNTYQCYLKDAYDNVTLDVELARREGWCFGAKLVRGAYMAQERTRAAEIGYEDPINPTYEATNAMYHRCLNYVLEELKHNSKAKVMVASHNEDTVHFTLRRMEELGLYPADRQVYFGQLLGMCDQISFPLGQAGFPVYKYVPYGPVMDVLPYLSRRALENSGVMKGAWRERQLLWQELKRRIRTGSLFHRPA
ncbi:proline dehydrogenase 1, mitochondrial isoform 3-T3 [Lycaon pictus]